MCLLIDNDWKKEQDRRRELSRIQEQKKEEKYVLRNYCIISNSNSFGLKLRLGNVNFDSLKGELLEQSRNLKTGR
jgi:hypothetical protein